MKFTKLVCFLFALTACGAEANEGQTEDAEWGQTSEAIIVNNINGLIVGSDSLGNQCSTSQGSATFCTWAMPYQAANAFTQPARFSVTVDGSGTFGPQALAAVKLILPPLNGELSNVAAHNTMIVDLNSNAQGIFISDAGSLHKTGVGDTHIGFYISKFQNGCKAGRIEAPAIPGTMQPCSQVHVNIDYGALKANFPASAFAGNLKQVIGAAVLMGLGEGLQSSEHRYSYFLLDTAVQSSNVILTTTRANQLRVAGVSEQVDGSDTVYTLQ